MVLKSGVFLCISATIAASACDRVQEKEQGSADGQTIVQKKPLTPDNSDVNQPCQQTLTQNDQICTQQEMQDNRYSVIETAAFALRLHTDIERANARLQLSSNYSDRLKTEHSMRENAMELRNAEEDLYALASKLSNCMTNAEITPQDEQWSEALLEISANYCDSGSIARRDLQLISGIDNFSLNLSTTADDDFYLPQSADAWRETEEY